MGNLQVWEPMEAEAIDEVENEVRSGTTNEFMKLDVGDNIVRFLPKLKGETNHVKVIHEHFVDDIPGHDGTVRFVCPRSMTKGKMRCPKCEEADALRKTGNPVDRGRAKDLYPNMRIYSNVINRAAEEEGPKILTFGKKVWEGLTALAKNPRIGGDYTDPTDNGFDVIITREGTGKNDTKYSVNADRNNSPLHHDREIMMDWLENKWPLDNYAVLTEPEELLAMLRGERPRQQLGGGRKRAALSDGRSRTAGRGKKRNVADDVEVLDAEYDDDVPY